MDDVIAKAKKAIKGATGQDKNYEKSIQLESWWTKAEAARKEIDWKWFQYDLWVNGNHYAKWDKHTQQITTTQKPDGRPKVTINKIYVTLRSVRSYVLQNRPKAEVTPYNMSEEDMDRANKLNLYLDYLHDRLSMRQKMRASLWHALKYSVGFWQVMYDDAADNGQGEISIKVIDPYDLYVDPTAHTMGEARYFILAVRRSIADLKEDPKYKDADWDKIHSDSQLASSTLKARLLSFERGQVEYTSNQDSGTAIVREFWYKEEGRVMLCTKIGDQIIRGPVDTGLERFPFFRLSSDVEPLAIYGHGWVKNLVPLNKLLNSLESSVAEYNDMINKIRVKGPKGAGIRVMTNQHGTFVEGKSGLIDKVEYWAVPPMNSAVFSQINNVNSYFEEVASYHDASKGHVPTGVKSGVGIEALREGDSTNLSELVENTEEFLEDVYEYVLQLASQKYQFARNVVTTTTTGEKQFLKVIGESADDSMKTDELLTVTGDNLVDVKIASWLAYTAEGKRAAMRDLASFPQMAELPPEYILKAYEIGPIANIVKEMKKREQETQQQEMAMQEQQALMQTATSATQQQMSQQIEKQAEPQGAGKQQAIAFIRAVVSGQMPDVPKQVSPEFVQYIDEFLQSEEAQGLGVDLINTLQGIRDELVLNMQK